ncbi:D-aminoacyl-tRNA deacylase 2-like [Ptychodera flava]|uniref:D-aminoacyl-tRNA deacylase 2-like n=1 Tax=Ptychodera flava TaxID=63121 RepID=UPI00396A16C5
MVNLLAVGQQQTTTDSEVSLVWFEYRMLRAVLYVRYLRANDGKRVSVLELPGDVLIVPQSTLGGIRKNRHVSYNYNINKAEACELYREFVEMCRREVMSTEETTCRVRGGNYDNKYEDMNIETGRVGLMTHVMEF